MRRSRRLPQDALVALLVAAVLACGCGEQKDAPKQAPVPADAAVAKPTPTPTPIDAAPATAEAVDPGQVAITTLSTRPKPGDRDTEAVMAVMRDNASEVRRCYERALQSIPGLAGKVVVAFTVGRDGAVSRARIASSTMKNSDVESCIAGVVSKLKFPARAEPREVTFPFVFQAR